MIWLAGIGLICNLIKLQLSIENIFHLEYMELRGD